jgi:hypothetical protein
VEEVLARWTGLLGRLPDKQRGELMRSMGLKMVRPAPRRAAPRSPRGQARHGGVPVPAACVFFCVCARTQSKRCFWPSAPAARTAPVLQPTPAPLLPRRRCKTPQEQLKAELKELGELHD